MFKSKPMPFIKKFKTKNFSYIYDVNTNEILKVDEVIYDLINSIYYMPDEEIIRNYLYKYPKDKIKVAIKKIKETIKNKNLFSSNRPQQLKFPYNSAEIKERLCNKLKNFTLEVTENCNMRCRYCVYSGKYYFARNHSRAIMDKKTAFEAIDFFFHHNNDSEICCLGFWGGEPLLELKLIKECIEYAKAKNEGFKKKLEFALTTNGTLLNRNTNDFLKNEKVILAISIDGPSEIHNQNRIFKNGKGTFDLVYKNIFMLKNMYPDYYEKYVSFIGVIAPPFDLLQRENFFNTDIFKGKQIKLNPVCSDDTSFFKDYDELIFSRLSDQYKQIRLNYFNSLRDGDLNHSQFATLLNEHNLLKIQFRTICSSGLEDNFKVKALCIPGQLKPFVDVHGRINLCEKSPSPVEVGNIKTGFYIDKIKRLIADYIAICNSMCRNCWAIRFCNLCYITAMSGENINIEKKKKNCMKFKSNILEFLIGYNEILEQNPKALDFLASANQ